MSAVTYHGEYGSLVDSEGHRYIEHGGYTFTEGKSTNVTDKGDLLKLAQNRFFKAPDSDKEDVEQGKDEAELAETETLRAYLKAENVPSHHKMNLATLKKLKDEHERAKADAAAEH